MRILYFLTLICFSSTAFGLSWAELEKGESYRLGQSLQLKTKERSGAILDLIKGEKAKFQGVIQPEATSMKIYQFKYKNCPGSELVTELGTVQSIQASGRVVKMNAELTETCLLQFYVEGHDGQTNSLFY